MENEITVINNAQQFQKAMEDGVEAALTAIGEQAVSYAKNIITKEGRRDTGDMINATDYDVRLKENAVYIGNSVKYSIYNEYGTGKPAGGRSGGWYYRDDAGNWHYTEGMKGIHFIRDSVKDHISQYENIARDEIKKHLP